MLTIRQALPPTVAVLPGLAIRHSATALPAAAVSMATTGGSQAVC